MGRKENKKRKWRGLVERGKEKERNLRREKGNGGSGGMGNVEANGREGEGGGGEEGRN